MDYSLVFPGESSSVANFNDVLSLLRLKGDSYEYVVSQWDGTRGTPPWLIEHFGAQRVVFVSEATL
jgi:hypothetical protein